MSKPQVYLNATQERLQSWKNCKRQHRTLNFRGMSSVPSGTWSAGSHGRVSCRAKVPRRPHWSSVCHISNVGWLHKGRQVEHKPSGKSREEEVGRCPTSTHKHCLGTRGEEAKTQLEAATGQEVPLHQQQIKDQTKQALVTEKKKTRRKFRTITGQLYSKPWEENGAEPPWLYFQNTEDKNTFANGKKNSPQAKCAKSTQLLMMKPLALWMRAVQQTPFPRL